MDRYSSNNTSLSPRMAAPPPTHTHRLTGGYLDLPFSFLHNISSNVVATQLYCGMLGPARINRIYTPHTSRGGWKKSLRLLLLNSIIDLTDLHTLLSLVLFWQNIKQISFLVFSSPIQLLMYIFRQLHVLKYKCHRLRAHHTLWISCPASRSSTYISSSSSLHLIDKMVHCVQTFREKSLATLSFIQHLDLQEQS